MIINTNIFLVAIVSVLRFLGADALIPEPQKQTEIIQQTPAIVTGEALPEKAPTEAVDDQATKQVAERGSDTPSTQALTLEKLLALCDELKEENSARIASLSDLKELFERAQQGDKASLALVKHLPLNGMVYLSADLRVLDRYINVYLEAALKELNVFIKLERNFEKMLTLTVADLEQNYRDEEELKAVASVLFDSILEERGLKLRNLSKMLSMPMLENTWIMNRDQILSEFYPHISFAYIRPKGRGLYYFDDKYLIPMLKKKREIVQTAQEALLEGKKVLDQNKLETAEKIFSAIPQLRSADREKRIAIEEELERLVAQLKASAKKSPMKTPLQAGLRLENALRVSQKEGEAGPSGHSSESIADQVNLAPEIDTREQGDLSIEDVNSSALSLGASASEMEENQGKKRKAKNPSRGRTENRYKSGLEVLRESSEAPKQDENQLRDSQESSRKLKRRDMDQGTYQRPEKDRTQQAQAYQRNQRHEELNRQSAAAQSSKQSTSEDSSSASSSDDETREFHNTTLEFVKNIYRMDNYKKYPEQKSLWDGLLSTYKDIKRKTEGIHGARPTPRGGSLYAFKVNGHYFVVHKHEGIDLGRYDAERLHRKFVEIGLTPDVFGLE